jgi:hypothetical protein
MRTRKQQLDFFRQTCQQISWQDLPQVQQKEVQSLLSLFVLASLGATVTKVEETQGGRHANED